MLDPKPYFLPFLLSLVLALILTPIIRIVAIRFGFMDRPGERKVHQRPTPRLGGVAIFLSFIIVTFIYYFSRRDLFVFAPWHDYDLAVKFGGILIGAIILVIVGVIDDKRSLSPWIKLVFQIIASLIVIISGTRVEYLNNPLGGFINFDTLIFNFNLFGISLSISPLSDLITLIWIVGIINVINFLDGLDGLAAGVSFFSAVSIFFVSLLLTVYQPATALLAAILAGSLLGFLPFNFNPAKIFMGDSGSHFLGYALAILAIISGAKMATAFLVLGFPILDGLFVVIKRIFVGRSPFRADKSHLHHRLLAIGFSVKGAVIFIWLLTLIFGLIGILSTTYGKMLSGILLIIAMLSLSFVIAYFERKKNVQESN